MTESNPARSKVTPVILAGGSGTRLWPLSRSLYPKQFLALHGQASLLQDTLARAAACCTGAPLLVCNEEHRFLTAEQVRAAGVDGATILLEPAARNTAPAIAAAAWHLVAQHSDAIMAVMPADHVIDQPEAFSRCLAAAVPEAQDGALATFGISPTRPATGFGYIQAAAGEKGAPSRAIRAFVEKPDTPTAERFLAEGDYYWNAGIFVFKASRYLEVLAQNEPEMHRLTQAAVAGAEKDLDFVRLAAEPFAQAKNESIDYAIMEKAEHRVVIPMTTHWSDVGSWEAVFEAGEPDSGGNVTHGDTLLEDSKNCLVYADSRLVTTVGLEHVGVIETVDSVLVTDLSKSQNTKRIATLLRERGRSEVDVHRTVYRPWGSYESIAMGDRFQVKRIVVKPGAKLSLQKHHHRAEHWIVVHGTAVVTIDDSETQLSENQSTYIPLGAVHRLANPGRIALTLIEVQSGSYLGEDDIVRLEDVYGRG